jgi:hypothetical protein
VHTFNSLTRKSTARSICCVRTYKNRFKYNYYTNTKLRLLVATYYKKIVTLHAQTCSIKSFSTASILIYY